MKKSDKWILIFSFVGLGIIILCGIVSTNRQNNSKTYTTVNTSDYANSADSKLQYVLGDIAGTYELVENKGIYGFSIVYTVTINSDGTGRMVYSDGSIETFSSASLSGSNKIVFSGNYGGTVFLLSGEGIEDESAKRYVTEAGTPKYIMRKR
jgi:hypothetical protein